MSCLFIRNGIKELHTCHLDAVEQAREYINAEADCLSILTDTDYFGGSLQDLWDVVDFLELHERSTPCAQGLHGTPHSGA